MTPSPRIELDVEAELTGLQANIGIGLMRGDRLLLEALLRLQEIRELAEKAYQPIDRNGLTEPWRISGSSVKRIIRLAGGGK